MALSKSGKSEQRLFGCHVSAAGGIHNAVKNAELYGVNTIQLHPSAPQRWITKPFAAAAAEEFLRAREGSGLCAVFFHGIYLINLANPDPQQSHLSRSSLLHYLNLNSAIGGDGVIFHVGSMKDEPDEARGHERAADCINWVLEKAEGTSMLLLEVAAGSGKVIGDRFEDLAAIYSQVENKRRVGFALDTQHMWASGYDLRQELDAIIDQADSVLGLDKIKAIHLNDSKTELGSRKDRHENFGDGLIGLDAMTAVFMHKRLQMIPFILETPDLKSDEGAIREVAKLKALAG